MSHLVATPFPQFNVGGFKFVTHKLYWLDQHCNGGRGMFHLLLAEIVCTMYVNRYILTGEGTKHT